LNIESGETEVCKKSQKKLEEDREEDGRAGGFLYFRKGLRSEPRLFGTNIANASRDLEQISQTPQRREAKMTLEVQVNH
jgi:hypothetical protein